MPGNSDKVLHIHHEGEDLLMCPQLEQRVLACALHVGQMVEHHRQVTEPLQMIKPLRLRWIKTADAESATKSPDATRTHRQSCTCTCAAKFTRGDARRRRAEGGQHGIKQFDRNFLVGYQGMMLATNPSADRGQMFKEIPPPVRLAYRLVGRKLHRKRYATLSPAADPETF